MKECSKSVMRRLREPLDGFYVTEGSPEFSSGNDERWSSLRAGPIGFDLGAFPEDARGNAHYRIIEFRLADDRRASMTARNEDIGAALLVLNASVQ